MTSLEVTGNHISDPSSALRPLPINGTCVLPAVTCLTGSRVAGNQDKCRDCIREATSGKLTCVDVIQLSSLEQKAEKCQHDSDRAAICTPFVRTTAATVPVLTSVLENIPKAKVTKECFRDERINVVIICVTEEE